MARRRARVSHALACLGSPTKRCTRHALLRAQLEDNEWDDEMEDFETDEEEDVFKDLLKGL